MFDWFCLPLSALSSKSPCCSIILICFAATDLSSTNRGDTLSVKRKILNVKCCQIKMEILADKENSFKKLFKSQMAFNDGRYYFKTQKLLFSRGGKQNKKNQRVCKISIDWQCLLNSNGRSFVTIVHMISLSEILRRNISPSIDRTMVSK